MCQEKTFREKKLRVQSEKCAFEYKKDIGNKRA